MGAVIVITVLWARHAPPAPTTLTLEPTRLMADGYDSATLTFHSGLRPRITLDPPYAATVESVGDSTARIRAGVLPAQMRVRVEFPNSPPVVFPLSTTPAIADSYQDGTPDFLRLDTDRDRLAFRRWFTFLAETQYFQAPANRPAEINDCAALIRYAYRETFRAHETGWAEAARVPLVPAFDPQGKYHYPYTPLGAGLFRVRSGPLDAADFSTAAFAQFADAQTLRRHNTYFLTRDLALAQSGDLLFYHHDATFHSMIYLGASQLRPDGNRYVVYHTGPDGDDPEEIKRLTLAELLHFPAARLAPHPGQSQFPGRLSLEHPERAAMKTYLRLTLLLTAAAAGLSQSENQPYFALSSNQTFGSRSKPSVSMSAWGVDSLEFRVYRIDDPVKFFQQIENPHEFGARTPAPPHERTLLERVHIWKRSLRANIQREIRAQFTESPSARFEKMLPAKSAPSPGSRDTHYAEAPVLNAQQLVLSFVQPVQSHSRWDRVTVPVRVDAKGVYLVEAVKGELRAYTLLMVSDSVLITKTGKGRIVNVLMDRATGEPIRDAKVWMLGRNAELSNATTDGEGVATLPIPAGRPDDVRILAHNGADYAVTTLSNYAFSANEPSWMGYVYTDRPVYRPGHTVHFKGILRLRTAAGYEVPAGKAVSVSVQDQEQKPVYQKTLTTNANGSIADNLTLPASAGLGNYFIEVKSTVGEGYMSGSFEVQEYKKPEYEVRVTPGKARVLEGDTVQASVEARYYFGEPVSNAKVHYSIYRNHYWFPLWYDPDDSSNGDFGTEEIDDNGDQVIEGDAELDADGKFNLKFDTTLSEHKEDAIYVVEAHVTDLGKREVVGKGWVVATYGSFVLNATPDRYFYAPGSQASFTIEARDYDSKPISTPFHVRLFRYNYADPQQEDLKAETDGSIGASGQGTVNLTAPADGGSYRIEATARTPEGRTVQAMAYFFVSGGAARRTRNDRKDIQIIPDKKTYRAGDTAKLLFVTGAANTPLWVSVEGRDLQQYKLVRSPDTTAQFEIPVTVADEPGINVSASFVRNGDLYSGNKYLKVPPEQHQLNVKLATDKPQYQPGQTADYSIDVTGADGKPVPRGEFSLGVVDEAIYAVRRDTQEDPLSFFYGRAWNSVATENSLTFFFSGEAGKRRMQLAQLRAPSRLAQLKPDRMVQPKIRKAFPDTAFWAADVVTDSAGHAHAKVEFPDSLTTWRATARGVTPDTKVGGAVIKTIVRKNLILRLVVPRFFVQGDEVVISGVVHNYLTDTKTAHVSLDVTGLDVLEGAAKDVSIPSRGEARVDWRVRAQQVRTATVTGKALTNEESDAVELELPVNVPGVQLSQSRGGAVAAGAEATRST